MKVQFRKRAYDGLTAIWSGNVIVAVADLSRDACEVASCSCRGRCVERTQVYLASAELADPVDVAA